MIEGKISTTSLIELLRLKGDDDDNNKDFLG